MALAIPSFVVETCRVPLLLIIINYSTVRNFHLHFDKKNKINILLNHGPQLLGAGMGVGSLLSGGGGVVVATFGTY